MIRFIHTADAHFGVENYGKIDPQTGIHSRLLDFDRAFQSCVTYAIEHEVDFFLFSGDAYKTASPSPTQQRLLLNALLRLFHAKIPVIMIVGNHDHPVSFGKAHALEIFGQLPVTGFYIIAQPTTIEIPTRHGPVQIVGIPWPSRTSLALHAISATQNDISQAIQQAVGTVIQQHAQKLDPQKPAVLAGHLTVTSGVFSGSEKRAVYGTDPLFLPSQLALRPFDYVALGHLHRHQQLNSTGHPPIVYSGSPERVDFGERNEIKGFCDVTIHDKTRTEFLFVPTPTRPFLQIEVTIDATRSHTEQILAQLQQHDLTGAIVKIIYYLPLQTKDKVDVVVIQNACSQAQHLVGIFPVHPIEQRTQRSQVSADMHLTQLLSHYFATKPEWSHKQDQLLTRINELEQLVNEQEHEG